MDLAPIIIAGCPRSGTQMMARVFGVLSRDFFLITEHGNKKEDVPEEDTLVEDHRLWWENFQYQGWDERGNCPSIDVPISSGEAVQRIRDRYLQLAQGRRIVIKNPSHILYPGLVREVFPNAKFVYCVRNPWHTLQSMIRQGHERLLLLSPRAADKSKSLLYRAAIGWSDAFVSFQKSRDEDWSVASYEQLTESPAHAIAALCQQLGIQEEENLAVNQATTIPQASRSNFHFIKQVYRKSPDKARVTEEICAGCEEFDYPLTPDELEGDAVTYAIQKIAEKLKRKTAKWSRRRAA